MEEKDVQQLIARYLANEATGNEIETLLDWVAADSRNLKVFNEQVSTWSRQAQGHIYNTDAALRKLNSRIDQFEDVHRERSLSWSWFAIAASLAFFLMAGATMYFWTRHSIRPERLTTTSKADTLLLSDGSVVYVNAHSSIEYPHTFDGSSREVFLTGEAFFEVKRDPAKPFVIHTGEIQTQVLGTTFNVNASNGTVTVVVETGKVMVRSSAFAEILDPAERLVYNNQTESFTRTTADLPTELSWRYNTIMFDDTPLDKVTETLAQHYRVKFEFSAEHTKHCVITGKFRNESLETILSAIEFSVGVQFKRAGGRIEVSGDGCDKKAN